ncbi:MAG: DNA gyrase subunit A [Bacteroidales bacterium]|nr:DNA gyrase subunit A [Bacteroidales bacterium]
MDENNIINPENQEDNIPENTGEKIIKVNLENQMKSAYIDYSMSVIVSRALPDVRDGLKPVQRRVLYGMKTMGVTSRGAYRKSAKIVGEVMGNYHPHGDSAIYDTLARMAQWWSLRYPLVDPQGNFGSMDGDSPAAMRYTEARLEKISEEMLDDLDKDTVDFQNTFDDSSQEPTVLPTQIPGLLVNGSNGIAVGMATNMAPHNLSECVDGIIAYIDNRDIDTAGLMQYIKAPDFPTAGVIYGYEGVREAFETGRGRIVLRGETHFEEHNGHERIIATSVPYQVNKAEMIKKTADLVNDKKLEGLADIRDESDRKGIRVVYELKRDANPDVVLNKLFMMTPLQSSFNVNNVALVNGRPYTLNLKQLIEHFVAHRHEVVLRRTRFDLKKAEDRAHILEGLARAIDIVDEIIATIRACKGGTPEAKQAIMDKFGFDDPQASAIVAYRLGQLAGLEIKKIMDELDEIHERIKHFHEILQNEELQFQIIKDELLVIKEKYGDTRRTQIVPAAGEFRMEDIIADDAVVITISHLGYIKRTPLTEYRVQSRGGKGSKGSATRDTDFIEHIFTATNHNHLLFFTEQGKCYKLRAFEIPEEGKNSKGRAIQNLLPLDKDNKVMAYLNVKSMTDEEYLENNYIILCTKKGIIKKTNLAAYKNVRQNGIIAVNIREDDQLLEACLTSGNDEVLMAVRSGKAVRFNEQTVRPMGRTATGVKAITLGSPEDEVIGMVCINDPQQTVLVVSEKGFGKRSDIEDYRITNRGAKGVKTLNITDKTGDLIAIKGVTDDEDLMIINKSGIVIRMAVSKLRVMGRATQGVKLIDLRGSDEIAAVTKTEHEDEPEETEVPESSVPELVEGVEGPTPEVTEAPEPVEGPVSEGETTLEQ